MSSEIVKILFKDSFVNRLTRQIDFIAKDSPARAKRFKNQLLKFTGIVPGQSMMNIRLMKMILSVVDQDV